ncbi:hypothetical protein OTSUT76_3821 [Orientia tsutsugamushi str. UT76]|nr:hypothetical protein OTSUT76_3821 [Orientia tsutsugamushi str. UT76]
METAFHPLIYLFFFVSNLNCYPAFRSLKSDGQKNTNHLKPWQNKDLGTCVPSTGVFACIGEGDGKNRDFWGKIVKLEKVRYGSRTA